MEIRKYKPYGSWNWGEYDFYIKNKRVAKFRNQLIGLDYVYLYFMPDDFGDNYCIRIDKRYITHDEALEKAIRIVKKKMYLIATDILSDINDTKILE